MMAERFEYEIKKDVRNNPIVREVDRARHREMWRTARLGLFLVTVLVFSVWRYSALMSHTYEAGSRKEEIGELRQQNIKWRLEIEARRSPARIEELARRKLGMIEPDPADRVVIERVVQSPPPPHSVVASR
jgi:cell division protein FtsL